MTGEEGGRLNDEGVVLNLNLVNGRVRVKTKKETPRLNVQRSAQLSQLRGLSRRVVDN